LDESCK